MARTYVARYEGPPAAGRLTVAQSPPPPPGQSPRPQSETAQHSGQSEPSCRRFSFLRVGSAVCCRCGARAGEPDGEPAAEPLEPLDSVSPARPSQQPPCPRRRAPSRGASSRRPGSALAVCLPRLGVCEQASGPRCGRRAAGTGWSARSRRLSVPWWRTEQRSVTARVKSRTRSFARPSRRMRRVDIMRRAARVLGAMACGISQVHGAQISFARRCFSSLRPC